MNDPSKISPRPRPDVDRTPRAAAAIQRDRISRVTNELLDMALQGEGGTLAVGEGQADGDRA